MTRKSSWAYNNIILLISIVLLICSSFLIHSDPLVKIITSVFLAMILLSASYSIRRGRTRLFYFAIGVIVLREGSIFLIHNEYLDSLATLTNVLFFLIIVVQLIHQVARSKIVSRDVILEAINGYLLMGLSGSILFALVGRIQEHAFAFSNPQVHYFSEFIYFGFITQTTVGFGDIAPVSDLARLLTITMGICGQMYIAIIIAMLVGKYLSQQNKNL